MTLNNFIGGTSWISLLGLIFLRFLDLIRPQPMTIPVMIILLIVAALCWGNSIKREDEDYKLQSRTAVENIFGGGGA